MKTRTLVLTLLGVGTLVGFGIAASKTSGGKGSPTAQTNYRVQYIPASDGGFVAIVYIDGVEQDAQIGPMPSIAELEPQVATYMAGLDVGIFYTVHEDSAGAWYFDGWTPGGKATTDGPYASEQLANQAGTAWAKKAAVPIPAAAVA